MTALLLSASVLVWGSISFYREYREFAMERLFIKNALRFKVSPEHYALLADPARYVIHPQTNTLYARLDPDPVSDRWYEVYSGTDYQIFRDVFTTQIRTTVEPSALGIRATLPTTHHPEKGRALFSHDVVIFDPNSETHVL